MKWFCWRMSCLTFTHWPSNLWKLLAPQENPLVSEYQTESFSSADFTYLTSGLLFWHWIRMHPQRTIILYQPYLVYFNEVLDVWSIHLEFFLFTSNLKKYLKRNIGEWTLIYFLQLDHNYVIDHLCILGNKGINLMLGLTE